MSGQLIAGATILNVVTGAPRWAGALIGGGIMTVYFTAGGLLGSAWVNTLQLIVMVIGFAVALPFALSSVGGSPALFGPGAPPWFGDITYSSGPGSGWTLLAQSYAFVANRERAETAVQHAVALGVDEPTLRARVQNAERSRAPADAAPVDWVEATLRDARERRRRAAAEAR